MWDVLVLPIGCSLSTPSLHILDLNQFLEQTADKVHQTLTRAQLLGCQCFCWRRALLELTRLICGKITFWYNFGRGPFVCPRLKHSVSLWAVRQSTGGLKCTNEKYKLVYKLCFNITTEEHSLFSFPLEILFHPLDLHHVVTQMSHELKNIHV